MIVRHRTQNFPDGGGAIGPAAPGAAGTTYAPETGAADARRSPPTPPPGGGGGSGADVVPAFASTWGRVYPHLAQNNAPSGPISPQCRQTVTAGARLMPYITVKDSR